MKYFNYATGLTMTNDHFHNLFGQKPRNPKNEKITQFHMDIASSIQAVTEEIVLRITKNLAEEYKSASSDLPSLKVYFLIQS